jgi:hypothetical protein
MKIHALFVSSFFALISVSAVASTCRLEREEIQPLLQSPQTLFEFAESKGCRKEVISLPAYGGARELERISFVYTWEWRGGTAGSAFGECFKKAWMTSDATSCIFP